MRKHTDIGILILRLGIGAMFLLHGAPKLLAGPDKWSQLGAAMSSIGVTAVPAFWGLMASVSEFFGGICLILGAFTRGASFLLLLTMFIASSWHITRGDGLMGSSHAIELGVVFLGLLVAGPGRFSLDDRLRPLVRLIRKFRRAS
jgi:putative oxidoreductase